MSVENRDEDGLFATSNAVGRADEPCRCEDCDCYVPCECGCGWGYCTESGEFAQRGDEGCDMFCRL